MRRLVRIVFSLFVLVFFAGLLMGLGSLISLFNHGEERVSKDSIVSIDLDGPIVDGRDFLDQLRKFRKDDRVKGILVRISSPGGVVGPSQELHDEITRTRETYKKPVVAYCSSVAASGAYYAAVAADRIVTTPGCMIGSIGALMEFTNLEKLYDFARVKRYSITTGKFKDAGAEYRALQPEERALFQDMLFDVLRQFKEAIVAGRKMKMEFLDKYADGRIFTGAQAVKLGFADETGTWDDARRVLGRMAGLGDHPKTIKAKKARGVLQMLQDAAGESASKTGLQNLAESVLRTELQGVPLFILPHFGHL